MSAAAGKSRGNLVGDLIAGMTTGVANIPDAMASAILAGANPVQGLYAIMIGTPLGAIFGSSAFMNVAATSALAITAGMALESFSGDAHATAIATLAVLTGLIMAAAGLLKLGRLLRFVANSVVIGFLTGVSINVILSQLGDFTGYSSSYSNKVVKAVDTLLHLDQVDVPTTVIGLLTVAVILLVNRTRLRNFSMLIGMVLGSALVILLGLATVQQVNDVATIPTSLPMPRLPDFSLILSACQPIVVPAPNAAPAIAAAYTPRFEPAPCRYPIPEGDKVECGYLVVPEDSGQPDGPTIRLHVVNFKSKSDTPKPDPVFVVHGGPGAAGGVIDWIWTSEPFASACRAVAQDIGPATAQVVEQLLADPVVDRLATARRLLKLRSRYDDGRLEAACHRALRFGDPAYRTVKRILDTGQDRQPLNLPAPTAIQVNAQTFMRTATEIFGDVLGGLRWN